MLIEYRLRKQRSVAAARPRVSVFRLPSARCFGGLRLSDSLFRRRFATRSIRVGVNEERKDRCVSGWFFRFYQNTAFSKNRNTEPRSGTGLQKQKDSCLLIMVPIWRPIESACSLSVAISPGARYPQASAVSNQWWVSWSSPSQSVSFERKCAGYLRFATPHSDLLRRNVKNGESDW